jgi:hypothetical protein
MYCSTPAGRVAYSTSGAGPPLLFDSGGVSHLRGQLELFAFGTFVERLAERFIVIRYDKPGCGLSDRDGIDLSFDGQVAAALAVADAVGAGRFGLFGPRRAVSWPPRSRRGTRTGSTRWCYTGCAPAAAIWRLPRSGTRSWRGAGPLGPGAEGAGRAFVTDPAAEELEGFTGSSGPAPRYRRYRNSGRRTPTG